MKIRLATLFLVILPFAVFFAGMSRTHVATIHVGMTLEEVSRTLRSASAIEVPCPNSYVRVQTRGGPENSTYWQLPRSSQIVETVTYSDEILIGLYLDAASTEKLTIKDRGLQMLTFNELTEDELAKRRRNGRNPFGIF